MDNINIVCALWVLINFMMFVLHRDDRNLYTAYYLTMQVWVMFGAACWWLEKVMG
jgi:hypothetical protein